MAVHRARLAAQGVRALLVQVHDDDRAKVAAYAREFLAKRVTASRPA